MSTPIPSPAGPAPASPAAPAEALAAAPSGSLLGVHDHSRDAAGLRYIYPVMSRRAGGVSVGINLNVNNACNWACTYCQVPDLTRGGPPPVDLARLREELAGFLAEVCTGDFMRLRVPEGLRHLRDIAFSGNGEPTAARDFAAAVAVVCEVMAQQAWDTPPKLVVISNGSHVHVPAVQQALAVLAARRGELWFKLDRGTRAARLAVNGVDLPDALVVRRLCEVSRHVPTWLQTCVFADAGQPPSAAEQAAYVALVAAALAAGARLQGVLLYTLARPSLQPAGAQLAALPAAELAGWADAVRALGLEVRVSA